MCVCVCVCVCLYNNFVSVRGSDDDRDIVEGEHVSEFGSEWMSDLVCVKVRRLNSELAIGCICK